MPAPSRRDALTDAATDYVWQHGLIGLSLRPLAAALGTSDRMLVYHFGSKDELVAAVLRRSNERSMARIRALPASASARQGVLDLWALLTTPELLRCQRAYVEAAALGLFGREPYAGSVKASNDEWLEAMCDHLVVSGVPVTWGNRAATLVDAAFNGFLLDLPLEGESPSIERAVDDLARAVEGLTR